MRKQSSGLHLPRGSRGEPFSMGHPISASFTKFSSRYIAGGMGGVSGVKQDNQGLWQDILKSCLKNENSDEVEDLHGTIFLMGRANSGKSELMQELKRICEKDKEKNKEQKPVAGDESSLFLKSSLEKNPYIGLDFSNIKISGDMLKKEDDEMNENTDNDESNLNDTKMTSNRRATIDIWSIDHCEMSNEIVKRLVSILNSQNIDASPGPTNVNNIVDEAQTRDSLEIGDEDTRGSILSISGDDLLSLKSPNIMFLIILDGSLPWTLNDDFSSWIQEIQSIWMRSLEESKLSPQLQNIMIQEISHYFNTFCSDGVGINENEDSNDNGSRESYPRVNIGIPIGVVITKSDVGKRFTVPTGVNAVPLIPFSLSFLMSIGDSYGMSYFITSIEDSWDIHQSFGVDMLLKYVLHRLFYVPLRDEEGVVLNPFNNVITRNNSIICVLPRTPLNSLPIDVPDVKNLIYEELVQKSNYSATSSENKDKSLCHGLSTAFDNNIPSLNDFLESIRSQVPEIESHSSKIGTGTIGGISSNSGLGGESSQYSPTSGTSGALGEDVKSSSVEQQQNSNNLKGSSPLSVSASQRLKTSKSTLNQSNAGAQSNTGGDPSLKGFFQSLIQRGEKKNIQTNRSSLKPAPSANIRKDSSSKSGEQLPSTKPVVAEKEGPQDVSQPSGDKEVIDAELDVDKEGTNNTSNTSEGNVIGNTENDQ